MKPHQSASHQWTLLLRVLFTGAVALIILFIFSNSAVLGEASSLKSKEVTELLNRGLSAFGLPLQLSEGVVRKLAHVAEYALLGFFLMLTLRVYTRRVLSHLSWPLLLGLLIPVMDEFYQTFIPGRVGAVRDVIIDFVGVCLGVFVALFLLLFVRMLFVLKQSKTPL